LTISAAGSVGRELLQPGAGRRRTRHRRQTAGARLRGLSLAGR
jgi:hypothetical protein